MTERIKQKQYTSIGLIEQPQFLVNLQQKRMKSQRAVSQVQEKSSQHQPEIQTFICGISTLNLSLDEMWELSIKILQKPGSQRTQKEIQFLTYQLESIKFISSLTLTHGIDIVFSLCKAITYEKKKKDEAVFHYGSFGNKFYIILRGKVKVIVSGQCDEVDRILLKKAQNNPLEEEFLREKYENVVFDKWLYDSANNCETKLLFDLKELGAGEAFGELALMQSSLRSATILCKEDCELAVLDKSSFNSLLKEIEEQKFYKEVLFLENVLGKDSYQDMKQIFLLSKVKEYNQGEIVFKENDKAAFVYISLKGQFQLYKSCKVLLNTKIQQFSPEYIGQNSNIYPSTTKQFLISLIEQGEILCGEEVVLNKPLEYTLKCACPRGMLFQFQARDFLRFMYNSKEMPFFYAKWFNKLRRKNAERLKLLESSLYKFPNQNIYDSVDKEGREDLSISQSLKNVEKNCIWNIIQKNGVDKDIPNEKKNQLIIDIYSYLLEKVDQHHFKEILEMFPDFLERTEKVQQAWSKSERQLFDNENLLRNDDFFKNAIYYNKKQQQKYFREKKEHLIYQQMKDEQQGKKQIESWQKREKEPTLQELEQKRKDMARLILRNSMNSTDGFNGKWKNADDLIYYQSILKVMKLKQFSFDRRNELKTYNVTSYKQWKKKASALQKFFPSKKKTDPKQNIITPYEILQLQQKEQQQQQKEQSNSEHQIKKESSRCNSEENRLSIFARNSKPRIQVSREHSSDGFTGTTMTKYNTNRAHSPFQICARPSLQTKFELKETENSESQKLWTSSNCWYQVQKNESQVLTKNSPKFSKTQSLWKSPENNSNYSLKKLMAKRKSKTDQVVAFQELVFGERDPSILENQLERRRKIQKWQMICSPKRKIEKAGSEDSRVKSNSLIKEEKIERKKIKLKELALNEKLLSIKATKKQMYPKTTMH